MESAFGTAILLPRTGVKRVWRKYSKEDPRQRITTQAKHTRPETAPLHWHHAPIFLQKRVPAGRPESRVVASLRGSWAARRRNQRVIVGEPTPAGTTCPSVRAVRQRPVSSRCLTNPVAQRPNCIFLPHSIPPSPFLLRGVLDVLHGHHETLATSAFALLSKSNGRRPFSGVALRANIPLVRSVYATDVVLVCTVY